MHTLKTLALLPAVVLAAAATNASAQDATTPEFSWTGPYVGVNGGYALNAQTQYDRTTGDLPNNTNAITQGLRPENHLIGNDGYTVGGQIGYNYDGGRIVVGLEADAEYTNIDQVDTLANTTFIGAAGYALGDAGDAR